MDTKHFEDRRRFLGAAAAGATFFAAGLARAVTEDQIFPVIETADGRVRGLSSGGILVFKGLHYGADTSALNRFMPPMPVTPWAGVRDATAYGNYAPQLPADRRREYADLIMYDLQPGGMGEDCLVMNLWTPTKDPNAKLPVMVHLHGGGFYAGSGNSPQFDGEMLARFGNAVVITVNHRLGSFGYLNLAALGGSRYAHSGAVGMLDIAAALRWIAVNVAQFGGDAKRVLVFGQSGGGQKTAVLMAMPSAHGLFHRAGVMSGPILKSATLESSAKVAEQFLNTLGLNQGSIAKLHELSMQKLLAAQVTLEEIDRAKGEAPRSFTPVIDGEAISQHPFDPGAPALSNDVPVVVGTTLDERAYRKINFDLNESGLQAYIEGVAGADASQVLKMYRDEDPAASPFILQARIDSDLTFQKILHQMADGYAQRQAAPTYAYLWKIPSPAYGGRYGAPHGTDIGPSMHDIRNGLNGPTFENVRLADQLASAWVNFAASGDPNNSHLPSWGAYALPERATMVFDKDSSHSAMQNDPRRPFRQFWAGR